jgi:aspartate aminotransferase
MGAFRLASRMERIGTETAFAVGVRARALEEQGRDIVKLQIGEPDFDTPPNIVDAAVEALRSGWTHYGAAAGDPELRAAIADYIQRSRGAHYSPEQVVVTPGGKPVMFFLILALLEAGDEAIYPDPGFPIYRSMIDYAGATSVPIPLREEKEFRLDVDELERLITGRTRLLILNSPGNPTGGVLSRDDLERIAKLAVQHDLVVLADEIYSELIYEGEHVSIATFPGMAERTVILDSFSKTYAMTGWRLGYGLLPEPLVEPVVTLMVNSNSCTNVATQRAGIEALTGPQNAVSEFREAFRSRRQLIVDGLNDIPGITCVMPHGAFYAFPNISSFGMTSDEFELRLLNEFGVAGVSGTSFGAAGEGYLRLSYAASEERLGEALVRMRQAAEAWGG